jgi:hypothetical protein
MNESREQALQRLLAEVESFDFLTPRYESSKFLVEDITSVLQPFMQNPEQHSRHVSIILEYAMLAFAAGAFQPILKMYNLPFLRGLFQGQLTKTVLQPLKERVQAAKDDVLTAVDPVELKIDILPIASIATKTDWSKQGRRLILIETRGVALPTTGMQLRSISHHIQITSPVSCQFVDAVPSNEMEILGQREVSITERGKFVNTETDDASVTAGVSGGGGKLEASAAREVSRTSEAEATSGEKLSHASQTARVISTAVAETASWKLLRTPSQLLLGSSKYSATALVPADAKSIRLVLRYGAEIAGWGPTAIQREVEADLPLAIGE